MESFGCKRVFWTAAEVRVCGAKVAVHQAEAMNLVWRQTTSEKLTFHGWSANSVLAAHGKADAPPAAGKCTANVSHSSLDPDGFPLSLDSFE